MYAIRSYYVSAAHSEAQVDRLLEVLGECRALLAETGEGAA